LLNTRELPDEKDLNRCFPGNKNGSFGARIAYDLMKTIIPLIDFGVDFHTGGAKINNYPQLRCVFNFPDNEEIAKLIGKVERSGYTLVPIDMHYKTGRIKIQIGLAKGKKQYDKRQTEKEKDWERDKARIMRSANKK
jgi:predicted deacylase